MAGMGRPKTAAEKFVYDDLFQKKTSELNTRLADNYAQAERNKALEKSALRRDLAAEGNESRLKESRSRKLAGDKPLNKFTSADVDEAKKLLQGDNRYFRKNDPAGQAKILKWLKMGLLGGGITGPLSVLASGAMKAASPLLSVFDMGTAMAPSAEEMGFETQPTFWYNEGPTGRHRRQ